MTEKELTTLKAVLADLDYVHYLARKAQGMDIMERTDMLSYLKRNSNKLRKLVYPPIPKV